MVVVVAVHGGDSCVCVTVVVLLYDCTVYVHMVVVVYND